MALSCFDHALPLAFFFLVSVRVEEVRDARDLLEAIVFPGAFLARGFESYTIVMTSGQALNGGICRELVETVLSCTAAAAEIRIPREDLQTPVPGLTSVMPQGFTRR